jgi:hypothetical protein
MKPDAFLLSPKDHDLLMRFMARLRAGEFDDNKPSLSTNLADEHYSTSTYVAKVPAGGIPPRAGLSVGTAECEIYRVDEDDLLEETATFARDVYNLSLSGVNGAVDIYVPIVRDVYGKFFAVGNAGLEDEAASFGTGTGVDGGGGGGGGSITAREVAGTVNVSVASVSTLSFYAEDTAGVFTVTDMGGGEAWVGVVSAGIGNYGVVSAGEQWFGGRKKFSDSVLINIGSQTYHLDFDTSIGVLAQMRGQGTDTDSGFLTHAVLQSIAGYHMFSVMEKNAANTRPIFHIYEVGFPADVTPAFAITDSNDVYHEGATAVVSGLTFVGGLYISGTVTGGGLSEAEVQDLIDASIATHEGAGDPHPGYLTAAEGNAAYQPLDADLTSLAGASGTNTIYYRSAANTWSAVTVGAGLSFAGGTLAATGGTGDVVGPASATDNALARYDGTTGKLIQDSLVTVSDTGAVTVAAATAVTNSATDLLTITHNTSGTVAAGFGTRILLRLEATAGDMNDAASVVATWTNAAAGLLASRLVLNAHDGTTRECMRMEATGAAANLGFFGVNAVARQTGDVGTGLVALGLFSGTPTFAYANVTGGPAEVSQADLDDDPPTSTDFVTARRMQHHLGTAKGWVVFTGSTGAIRDSANVTSVTRHGVGDYTITWATDFSDGDYAVDFTVEAHSDGTFEAYKAVANGTLAAGSLRIKFLDGGAVAKDYPTVMLTAHGRQA